jgi:ribosome biogenesis GTPase / thiamine phosphate phosphatase
MAKKKRVDFRKNLSKPPRVNDLTSGFREHGFEEEAPKSGERVRSKGDQSRKRTISVDETGQGSMPAVDLVNCVPGRIIRCHGLDNVVHLDDGRILRCKVRRLLKSLAIDERSIVTTGDRVWVRPSLNDQGFIERVEPRHGLLTRASRGREHILVANVDQVAIVIALVEPELKPHLIDRYLASAEQGKIKPILCLNKVDLTDPAEFQPIVGYYSQLGVPTILTSATTGVGIDRLRRLLKGRQSVFSGQSGVGKSSLLNAVQPGLGLQVRTVSDVNQKGRHTTTTTQLLELEIGGWVVDTPGIRTFDLWNIIPEEVEGLFAEFRPFVTLCGFPDCTHTHEQRCAVKQAVEDRRISEHRYLSYLGIYEGKMEDRAEEE